MKRSEADRPPRWKNRPPDCGKAGEEGSIVVEKVKFSAKGIGYNALTGKYEDMMSVVLSILQGGPLGDPERRQYSSPLTTESVVADKPDEDKNSRNGRNGNGRHAPM